MFLRVLALVAFLSIATSVRSQEAFSRELPSAWVGKQSDSPVHSAWLDLRQNAVGNSNPQSAPSWVEAVTLVPVPARDGIGARTIFRIRIVRPRHDAHVLLFRLFFDDKPSRRPAIMAWDESGTQLLQSGPLGAGIDLPSSDTVTLPMIGITCVDVEVPGDGTTVRGAYMDWMTSRLVSHPLAAQQRDVIPEPFAAAAPLHLVERDTETFGTVTAVLAPETIRIGTSLSHGASFQFGIEAQPLVALVTFEVSAAHVDSPPEIFVNGERLGPVSLSLPDLADPGYQGESEQLVSPMRFRYTGWLRAQKLVPAANLKIGPNDVIITSGAGTPKSAVRATQIQLKYLWDKSDYLIPRSTLER